MGRPEGFEPSRAGATIRCVNRFATIAIKQNIQLNNGRGSRNRTHIKGFGDLRFTIKLYPYYMVEGDRFELPTQWERIYSPPRLATSLPLHYNNHFSL